MHGVLQREYQSQASWPAPAASAAVRFRVHRSGLPILVEQGTCTTSSSMLTECSTWKPQRAGPPRYRHAAGKPVSSGKAIFEILDMPTPTETSERLLLDSKAFNDERQILPSETAVIDRLLARRVEMAEVYDELGDKLGSDRAALGVLLQQVVSTAAFWDSEKIEVARAHRAEIGTVNSHISEMAADLAVLLARRDELHNISGFSSDTFCHPCDVIDAAASHNPLYRSNLAERLQDACYQFDLKYWPSLPSMLHAISEDARHAAQVEPAATDPLTAVATAARRPSLADFFKALFAAIEGIRRPHAGYLPVDFGLSDNSVATLANCLLDVGPDDMVDAAYVKRLRQRERSARSNRIR